MTKSTYAHTVHKSLTLGGLPEARDSANGSRRWCRPQGLIEAARFSPLLPESGTVPGMDIAVNLVENYLRLTGYLTLSELEVQRRDPKGRYRTVTDVDVIGIRMPGSIYVGDPHKAQDCALLQLEDDALTLEDDMVDIILGEVKQGPAELNSGIKDHAVLHSVLRRFEWLFADDTQTVIEDLQRTLVHRGDGRQGGLVRVRIVAFGRADEFSETIIPLDRIISTMLGFFDEYEEAFRPIHFREPAPAFLRLLTKSGFDVTPNGDKQGP